MADEEQLLKLEERFKKLEQDISYLTKQRNAIAKKVAFIEYAENNPKDFAESSARITPELGKKMKRPHIESMGRIEANRTALLDEFKKVSGSLVKLRKKLGIKEPEGFRRAYSATIKSVEQTQGDSTWDDDFKLQMNIEADVFRHSQENSITADSEDTDDSVDTGSGKTNQSGGNSMSGTQDGWRATLKSVGIAVAAILIAWLIYRGFEVQHMAFTNFQAKTETELADLKKSNISASVNLEKRVGELKESIAKSSKQVESTFEREIDSLKTEIDKDVDQFGKSNDVRIKESQAWVKSFSESTNTQYKGLVDKQGEVIDQKLGHVRRDIKEINDLLVDVQKVLKSNEEKTDYLYKQFKSLDERVKEALDRISIFAIQAGFLYAF